MEKISWTNCVKNEEVLHTVKEKRNNLHTKKEQCTCDVILRRVNETTVAVDTNKYYICLSV